MKDTRRAFVQSRVTPAEKEGFEMAANMVGLSVSAWIRTELRRAALREIRFAGEQPPFLVEHHTGEEPQ